jgi:3-keto-L-gulonate-6-phosphate decarboxylase
MLDKKQKYLQIALNSTLEEARAIIYQIPLDKRIILEAGTPLIKTYGLKAIKMIRRWWEERIFNSLVQIQNYSRESKTPIDEWFEKKLKPFLGKGLEYLLKEELLRSSKIYLDKKNIFAPYIVADLKCMDRGTKEVEIAKEGGAKGAVVLGQAPIETINAFIEECENYGLDSMVDMMNVEYSLKILGQLKKMPKVVILHRGVDEETFDPESEIPYHEIHRIKENYDVLVAVAGGDTIQEVQRAIFNDADIVVVWKSFYQSTVQTAKLAEEFLKEIR